MGHEAVIRLLLAKDGVDPDSKDDFGQTPLSVAIRNGRLAAVLLLQSTYPHPYPTTLASDFTYISQKRQMEGP
jgi:ankyrin repeat protein